MIELWRLPKPRQMLLERVARAICAADGRDPDRSTHPRSDGLVIADVAIPEWRNYLPHVVAAADVEASQREAERRVIEAARAHHRCAGIEDGPAGDARRELAAALGALDREGGP